MNHFRLRAHPDKLVGRERHDLLPVRAAAAVVFVAEGDAGLVEGDQASSSRELIGVN